MDKEKKDWKIEKERLLSLSQEERRKVCLRQNFITLDQICTWRQECKENDKVEENEPTGGCSMGDKVSLYKGDITLLEVDAIVNAANSSLLGGGGVDGCIHKAAGSCLLDECHSLNGCETGKAKITCGYDLPAKYVIHTVGPVARGREGPSESSDLSSCYQNSLKLLMENNLTTVAFPCISTGIFGFPNKSAADIALKTVKTWIEEHPDKITRVIFCVFLETDFEIYREKMTELFQDNSMELPEEQLKADNTPPSKKSKSPRDQSDDINRDAVKDNDIQMESQNPDEMADEKPEDEAGEEEDDEAPDLKEREEDQPAAQPMEGGPGKPKEDMDDDSEDGESEAGNGEADEDQE